VDVDESRSMGGSGEGPQVRGDGGDLVELREHLSGGIEGVSRREALHRVLISVLESPGGSLPMARAVAINREEGSRTGENR
jgi:hypothetical protein